MLRDLAHPSCLLRQSLGNAPPFALPVDATVVPSLRLRYEVLTNTLQRVGVSDLTMITCMNREDVDALDHRQRKCLHPWDAVCV